MLPLVALLVFVLGPTTAWAPPFNPIPDPKSAAFTQEGSEPDVTPADPLEVVDPDTAPGVFANFFTLADDAFVDESGKPSKIVLNPSLSLEPGFIPAPDGNTAVHVTINDGEKEIRSVLLRIPTTTTDQIAVALVLPGGFSSAIALPDLTARWRLTRLKNGDAVLSVSGVDTDIVVQRDDLPGSMRPGEKTIEFGTYDVAGGAASATYWDTLGLPPRYFADLIGRGAWPEPHHFVVSGDADAMLSLVAEVENTGNAYTHARAIFEVRREGDSVATTLRTIAELLAPGERRTQFRPLPLSKSTSLLGKFDVMARAEYDSDEDGMPDTPGKVVRMFSFEVVEM